MITDNQFQVVDPDTRNIADWMIYAAKVADINYQVNVATIDYP